MIKIAHFADVHWRGLTRHDEYRKSFEDAFEKLRKIQPDVILIAGDIVHSKTQGISPELISCLTWWFRELGEIAPTHVTLGNHDGLIMNSDREDAVSPIVKAINHSKVRLHKESCVVQLKRGFNLCVFSCFDESGWKNVKPVEGEVNIATFHGAVTGSTTDENWEIEGDASLDFFKSFDFVMLGDIHKLQYLDHEKRVAYCGSTIQQNYGESIDKGFLLWAIESSTSYKSKFISVRNTSPFITLDFSGDIDELLEKAKSYPENSKFRIRIFTDVSAGTYSQIKNALKNSLSPAEIVFKQETEKSISREEILKDVSMNTMEDVKKLIFDFYPEGHLDEKIKETMSTHLRDAWEKSKIDDTNFGGKFQIKKMEFDNTFGYGENNVINFDKALGITGIFGKNRSGKSSICGTLSYGLYNGTDRGTLKNLHIVNARKNYCNTKIYFSKSGLDYVLERQTTKVVNKKGDTSAPTNLNLFLVDSSTGSKRDMSEEQRRETEKILRDLVGSLDDFLLTSLSSQGNINKFIDLSASARKASLSRFLKLEIFEQLNDALKEDLNVTKKILDSSNKDYPLEIQNLENLMKKSTEDRVKILNLLETLKVDLLDVQVSLSTKSDESYTQLEIDNCKNFILDVDDKLKNFSSDLKSIENKILDLIGKREETKTEISDLNKSELIEKKNELEKAEKNVVTFEQKLERKNLEIQRDKIEVKKLSDVPCGDSFPTCKYILGAKDAQKNLESKQNELEKTTEELENLKKIHRTLVKESIDEKLKKISNVSERVSSMSLEISQLETDKAKISSKIENFRNVLQLKNQDLNKMLSNVCDEESSKARDELLIRKKTLETEIEKNQLHVTNLSETIGKCQSNLSQLKKEKDEFEIRSHKHKSLKLLSKALSKNGIPLSVIRKSLPAINKELSNILKHATGFTIELSSDEETNDMEIFIDYGDSKRVIECGSGMEKMMSSIALRAALINVSNLPKSDLFIVDEGFGALDGKNLEACASLLRELSKNFKSVIVISHVDGIKDVVDHIIEIDSRGKDSYVNFD